MSGKASPAACALGQCAQGLSQLPFLHVWPPHSPGPESHVLKSFFPASVVFTDPKGCPGVFQDPLPSHPVVLTLAAILSGANGLQELRHKGICGLVFVLPKESKELERHQGRS